MCNMLLCMYDYSKRQKIHVPALRVWTSDDPHPQEEYLDCLWAQLQVSSAPNWSKIFILIFLCF